MSRLTTQGQRVALLPAVELRTPGKKSVDGLCGPFTETPYSMLIVTVTACLQGIASMEYRTVVVTQGRSNTALGPVTGAILSRCPNTQHHRCSGRTGQGRTESRHSRTKHQYLAAIFARVTGWRHGYGFNLDCS